MDDHETLECVDADSGRGECRGEVQRRPPSHRAQALPRCDAHFESRCEREQQILELEAPSPPQWFDPADAGERWSEDD